MRNSLEIRPFLEYSIVVLLEWGVVYPNFRKTTCRASAKMRQESHRRSCILGKFTIFHDFPKPCKLSTLYLALAWFAGLVIGTASANSGCDSLIRQALLQVPSFGSLLLVTALPVLLIALAFFIARPVLCLPIAFFKAFQFSYVAASVLSAYSHGRWLILFLWMFSDLLTLPLFWLCFIRKDARLQTIAGAFLGITLVCGINSYAISPFLANLI